MKTSPMHARPTAALPGTTALLAVLALTALLLPRPSQACGGCFSPPGPGLVVQDAERVLFYRNPTTKKTLVWVEVKYSGPAENFGWVLPLPGKPTVGVGTSYVFDRLDQATAPRFVTKRAFQPEGCVYDDSGGGIGCGSMSADESATLGAGAAFGGGDGQQNKVTVLEKAQAGPYDYEILQSTDAKALLDWLNKNKYDTPKAALPIIDDHLKKGDLFVAIKLQSGKDVAEIRPVTLLMDDTEPCVPLRLTSIAASDNLNVIVYLLGNGRAIPKNHLSVTVNPMKLRWPGGVNNYPQVLAAAIDEAAGRAFVTEFAGKAKDVRVTQPDAGFGMDTVALYSQPIGGAVNGGAQNDTPFKAGVLFDPAYDSVVAIEKSETVGQLVDALRNTKVLLMSDFAATLEAATGLAKAHGSSADVLGFWTAVQNRTRNVTASLLSQTVDGVKLAKDLKEGIIDPIHDVADALNKAPTLTRLMMRISPEEMDRDPIFGFHTDLPDVVNLHTAEVKTVCTGGDSVEDATRLTVQGGGSYILRGTTRDFSTQTGLTTSSALDPRWKDAPFALRVDLLDEGKAPIGISVQDTALVDTAIKGAQMGQPALPAGMVVADAGARWTPPADDPSVLQTLVVDDTRVSADACSLTPAQRRPLALAALLLAALLVLTLRRRRAGQAHRGTIG